MQLSQKTTSRYAQNSIIVLLCGLLSACAGFHLRNRTQITAPELRTLNVTGDAQQVAIVRDALMQAGVMTGEHSRYELQIKDYQTHRADFGYQGGSIGQYTLSGSLTWALATDSGRVILGPQTQSRQREYDYNRNSTSVSGLVQLDSFSRSVFKDLVQQMISRLAALDSAQLARLKAHPPQHAADNTENSIHALP